MRLGLPHLDQRFIDNFHRYVLSAVHLDLLVLICSLPNRRDLFCHLRRPDQAHSLRFQLLFLCKEHRQL